MLEVDRISIYYGRACAVRDLSITVGEGEYVGVVGANGVGKTSALMAICGCRRLSTGTVRLNGQRLSGRQPEEIVRQGVSLVPERRRIFARLSVRENLMLGATPIRRTGDVGARLDYVLAKFPILGKSLTKPGTSLSGGEQQQLAIGRALMALPKVLLLDEPSLGLSPVMTDRLFDTLKELHREGQTILLVEQNAGRTIASADRSYILGTRGTVLHVGTAEELAKVEGLSSSLMGQRAVLGVPA
jgi:branched-chain amino acid transport system ATP-binding protein